MEEKEPKNPVRPLFEMSSGKILGWRVKPGTALMEFAFDKGGQIPKQLKGSWTSIREMRAAAAAYLASGSVKEG
jgi:hypothetical protein